MLTTIFLAAALSAHPIPLDHAKRYFDEIRLAAEDDGGALWGVSLQGPMLLIDPETHFVVANVADGEGKLTPSNGVFTGIADSTVIPANTATMWRGTRWTMVMWGSISRRSVPRRRLLLHESFHRVQDGIGFPAANAVSPHLDTLEGRYWYQLELRALAAALRSKDEERMKAIADAVAFRLRRRSLFADSGTERVLENSEGLAEYTGWELRGTADSESRATLATALLNTDPASTFSRSFAYSTGPAYGLLLDAASPGWTRRYRVTDDLALVLAAAVKVAPSAPGADGAAQRYGGAELKAAEVIRDAENRAKIARYRSLFIDGPVLELPSGAFGFDPYTVTTIPDAGTVYGTFEVSGPWGSFKTETGALMTTAGKVLVPATAKDTPGLKLATGWQIVPGLRGGDYRVSR